MFPAHTPEKALRDLARSWQRERRRVLRDPEPEAVHRLRTVTRRLETGASIATALLGLAGTVPWSDWDGLKLKLSRLRDLDVTSQLLRETQSHLGTEVEALRRRIKRLNHERARARRRAVAMLRRRRTRRIARALKHPATPTSVPDLMLAAQAWWRTAAGQLAGEPAWLYSLAEALRLKAGRKEVHDVRIQVRELRYGLEWWNRLGLAAASPVVAFLQDAQDALGQIRDYQRAGEQLVGPEFRRARAVVAAMRAKQLARWPLVAEGCKLLGSSPFGAPRG